MRNSEQIQSIDAEVILNASERIVLSEMVRHEGFVVIQKVLEDQVRSFNRKLISTDPQAQDEVLDAHRLAKAVAQFYVGLMQRIEEECQTAAANVQGRPQPDPNLAEDFH